MTQLEEILNLDSFLIKEGSVIDLSQYATAYQGDVLEKKLAEDLLEEGRKKLAEIQELLYAHNKYAILIIFQAMDAAGKDGAVKHIMSGFNPMGVKVHSFKTPTNAELDQHYLWRHSIALPARGEIAIHNRSHYENVLITKVHPEYILNERIPGIDNVDKIDNTFWSNRYDQINRFEKNISDNGTVILKFFLHLSRHEQKERFMERIDNPSKNWKFSAGDIAERGYWQAYQEAYAKAISATSKTHAPWYVIPADNKWFTRLSIATAIYKTFSGLDMHYPTLNKKQQEELVHSRRVLENE
jgi:PPK2 family polyphosphate:nucleotide phosphotransferase